MYIYNKRKTIIIFFFLFSQLQESRAKMIKSKAFNRSSTVFMKKPLG